MKGILSQQIVKCINRGKSLLITKRYLSICYNINISLKCLINRVKQIEKE